MLPKDGTPVVIGTISGTSPCIILLYERNATGQSAVLVSASKRIIKLVGQYFSEDNTVLKCYIDSEYNITVALNYRIEGVLRYKIIPCY